MLFPSLETPIAPLADDLALSERLSQMQGQTISPEEVARVLKAAGVEYVLVGAHAISAIAGDPRATMDVDVIARDPARARDALAAAFPHLTAHEHPVVIRFKRDQREAIDIIRPTSGPLFHAALSHTTKIAIGDVDVVLPTPEMALALKFASMISIGRQIKDRYQDAHDFIGVVQHISKLNEKVLHDLGELVYPGGGNELLNHLANARTGKPLDL